MSLAATSPATEHSTTMVIRRNGKATQFDSNKIYIAISKAFLAVEGEHSQQSSHIHDIATQLTKQIQQATFRNLSVNDTIHIEQIQDQVELALMRADHHKVARAYVLYREKRSNERSEQEQDQQASPAIQIKATDGSLSPYNKQQLVALIDECAAGLEDISSSTVLEAIQKNLFDEIPQHAFEQAIVMGARGLIDQQPDYSRLAARLLLNNARTEALNFTQQHNAAVLPSEMAALYPEYFVNYIKKAISLELVDEELGRFDLQKLASAIQSDQDANFSYLGLQTLYDRYFIHHDDIRFELPQAFFMRVAMGLAINEVERESKAIEFYTLLSSFDFMSSTPTLFNSGTPRPQLSSCYLTTLGDDLGDIYSALKDNALLSKYAGGLGNDWTPVRGLGAAIKGTNGKSQGVIPFLKVANDTAVAVNQGGKRKGAVCAYLETWHIDIEHFLELRKNTGDERRRTHDMNTANWIPDLFMQRVIEEADWTLFSPEEVPHLHDLTGKEFEAAYRVCEEKSEKGEIKLHKTIRAVELWRKMLGMLFETGHPWITFKDPCNIRYTNQHVGVVHSSNLCTEITLHTNENEIAVCNLGSINLPAHIKNGQLDKDSLEKTINTAMRMLDNVIDYNFYSVPQARNSNLKHRPVGLGIMGFHDCLQQLNIAYASEQAVEFADTSMELISYLAIKASCELAKERGAYPTFQGSLWSQGILPIDSLQTLADIRGEYLNVDQSQTLDWDSLRQQIIQSGLRNSNCLAIAPTATISNICGISQSIEPTYQNMYVKSNLSGEFVVINNQLVNDLKKQGLWDEVMINDLKYYEGSIQQIERVPDELKTLYATAFEIDSRWLVEAASRRQKWLDQSQSLNLYMAETSGQKLDSLYKLAWARGLKCTYYLRSMGATHVEQTLTPSSNDATEIVEASVCSILDPDCDACQ